MKTAWMAICLLVVALSLSSVVLAAPSISPADQKVNKQLDTVIVSFKFEDKSVGEVYDFLQTEGKISIVLDKGKVDTTKPVTLKVDGVSLGMAIRFVDELLGLKYVVRNGAVFISDKDGVKKAH
jgi:transcription initiation factor TFIIIB Brf1 subunit/transcription initiation factor TFIIB